MTSLSLNSVDESISRPRRKVIQRKKCVLPLKALEIRGCCGRDGLRDLKALSGFRSPQVLVSRSNTVMTLKLDARKKNSTRKERVGILREDCNDKVENCPKIWTLIGLSR